MAAPESFEDWEAWQMARSLTNAVYGLCRREPLSRDFGFRGQVRSAALSVMNNLAEGWESLHVAEKRQFYTWARRSCGEVPSMSYVLLDNRFISAAEHATLLDRCIRTGKLISGLIRSLDNRR